MVQKVGNIKQLDRVILGENCVYSTDCNETSINNNVIVCGNSGCGKMMSISEPHLAEHISIFCEKKLSVTLSLQSGSQFESIYGSNEATTIINNCDSYLYMGGMNLKTAHNVSLHLNVPLDEVLYMPIG